MNRSTIVLPFKSTSKFIMYGLPVIALSDTANICIRIGENVTGKLIFVNYYVSLLIFKLICKLICILLCKLCCKLICKSIIYIMNSVINDILNVILILPIDVITQH